MVIDLLTEILFHKMKPHPGEFFSDFYIAEL